MISVTFLILSMPLGSQKYQNLTISFLKLQNLIINNFYSNSEQPEIYSRKNGIIVRNKRLTM